MVGALGWVAVCVRCGVELLGCWGFGLLFGVAVALCCCCVFVLLCCCVVVLRCCAVVMLRCGAAVLL